MRPFVVEDEVELYCHQKNISSANKILSNIFYEKEKNLEILNSNLFEPFKTVCRLSFLYNYSTLASFVREVKVE